MSQICWDTPWVEGQLLFPSKVLWTALGIQVVSLFWKGAARTHSEGSYMIIYLVVMILEEPVAHNS